MTEKRPILIGKQMPQEKEALPEKGKALLQEGPAGGVGPAAEAPGEGDPRLDPQRQSENLILATGADKDPTPSCSFPPPPTLEATIQMLRDQSLPNMLDVENPYPDLHVRFVKHEKSAMARRVRQGYKALTRLDVGEDFDVPAAETTQAAPGQLMESMDRALRETGITLNPEQIRKVATQMAQQSSEHFVVGDMILMGMPKKRHDIIEQAKHTLAHEETAEEHGERLAQGGVRQAQDQGELPPSGITVKQDESEGGARSRVYSAETLQHMHEAYTEAQDAQRLHPGKKTFYMGS